MAKTSASKPAAAEIVDGQVAALPDGDVAQIGHTGVGEDLLELSPQPALHLVLVEEDPVLGEAAGLDVAVQEQHAAAAGGERAGGEQARGAGADHRDHVNHFVSHGTSRK